MITDNIVLLTDGGKLAQPNLYPAGIEKVYNYLETRPPGGSINLNPLYQPSMPDNFPDVCFLGLQYLLKRYLVGCVVTEEKLDEAEAFSANHFCNNAIFNRKDWDYILKVHHGRLPITIKAVPEGTVVQRHNVLMTVENTDPRCYWLPNMLEPIFTQLWYGSTVATLSRELKALLLNALDESGTPEEIDFKITDYGFRSVSSVESAGIGGVAHLVNFKRSDNLAGMMFAETYYGPNATGYSIPLMDYNTVLSWNKSSEAEAYNDLVNKHPSGAVCLLLDTYDLNNATNNIIKLQSVIEKRDGTMYLCNDSGGVNGCLDLYNKLKGSFKTVKNSKGFLEFVTKKIKMLIQNQTYSNMTRVLDIIKKNRVSMDVFTFGMGGELLQKLSRDTFQFAYETSSVVAKGARYDVAKNGADKWKWSKPGRFKLVKNKDNTCSTVNETDSGEDVMREIFRDGELLHEYTLDDVRNNSFMF